MRCGVWASVVAAAMLAIAVPSSHAATAPSQDPFYAPPGPLAGVAPGTILRSRKVTINVRGVTPLGLINSYQLLYRTSDSKGQPVATVTTVLVPNTAAPEEGRTLLSLQDAEDSVNPVCAPSYQLQIGSPDNNTLSAEMGAVFNQLLLGRTLVVPDHEGPQSQWLATGMAGHATLDSIRAAEHFAPAQLAGTATKVGLLGYSGGAHATAAANELQPAYAPELNIVGVAAGGVPPVSRATVDFLDGSAYAGFFFAGMIGLDRAYREFEFDSLLNDKGKAKAQEAAKGCSTGNTLAPYTHFDDYTTAPRMLDLPRVAKVIATNALGHATPTAPTYYYNAITDDLVWIKPLDELVANYCAHGATLRYERDPLGINHTGGAAQFFVKGLAYLIQRYEGGAPPSTCTSPHGDTSAATSPAAATGRVRLRVASRPLHTTRRGSFAVRLRNASRFAVRIRSLTVVSRDRVRAGNRPHRVTFATLAKNRARTVGAGRLATVTLRLTRAHRRLLARLGRVRVRITARAEAPDGRRATARRTVTLVAR